MLENMVIFNIIDNMKTERLTTKCLENIKPEEIIYAEFAEGGAMGEPGTARLYALMNNEMHYFLVNLNQSSEEDDIHAYANIYTMLRELEEKKILTTMYGGYGNHVWKAKNAVFQRDDDNACFIYESDGREYELAASVRGVYFHVVAEFAVRPVDVKKLQKFRKKIFKKSSSEEAAFYDAYLEQVERNDKGYGYFDINVDDYWAAITYIRSLNYEEFNLSDDEVDRGIKALSKYRLKYLVGEISWRKFDKFMAELVELNATDLFFELNKYINSMNGEDEEQVFNIGNLFTTIKYVSSNKTGLSTGGRDDIVGLFEYPVIVKFTDVAHREIIHSVVKASGNELRTNAVAISYYIANYIFNEDTLSYADLLPAVSHIIEDLPSNDPNGTHPDDLYWLACEVIDRIWRYVSESKATQKKCRDTVYDLFAPRVGGIWPIVHYDEFEFKEKVTDSIFRESVGFLMALDDISEREASLKRYLGFYREGYHYPLESVERRAFYETLNDYESSEEKFEAIMKTIAPEQYPYYLDHPDTVKEATYVLDELFRRDEGARITEQNRIAMFEKLLLNGNSLGVGVAILNHLVKNFDEFSEIITRDCESIEYDPLYVMTTLYTAAAVGATEENELPPLKALTKKIAKYVTNLQIQQTMNAGALKGKDIRQSNVDVTVITEAALRYARKKRRTILFQRSSLQRFF